MKLRERLALWLVKSTLSDPEKWFMDWARGGDTEDGISVGPIGAQKSAVNLAAVNAVSQDIAKLPLVLYRRREDGGRERATDHPVYHLVRRPRPHLTSFAWREMVQAHCELGGNGYTRIVRDSRMRPTELIPLDPCWVTPLISTDGTPYYDVRMYGEGRVERLAFTDMLHIKGRTDDGYCGKSNISRARDVVAADIASANHGRRLYNNGARPAGLMMPKGYQLGKEGRELAERQFEEKSGRERQYRIIVTGHDFDYKQIGMTNLDAEWVESRKLFRDENASIHRMPPHKVGIMDHATFTNIEHQGQEYVTDTLDPIGQRWVQELNIKLLREDEQEEYYFEFQFDALLRGDTLSRMQAHQIAILSGIKSQNEAREQENLNKIEGGDKYYMPLNYWPIDEPRPEKTQAAQSDDPPPTEKLLRVAVTR